MDCKKQSNRALTGNFWEFGFPAVLLSMGLTLLTSACAPPKGQLITPVGTGGSFSNYIVVGSAGSQTVTLLDPNGNVVRDLLRLDPTTTEEPRGFAMFDSSRILISIEGGATAGVDRVMIVDLNSDYSSAQNFHLSGNLSGTLFGVARLASGDVIVTETNAVERFLSNGNRVTSGGWPFSLQTAGTGLAALSNGGFIHCSTGSDVVRAYNNAGTQTSTVASGIAATTDARDCAVSAGGLVGAAFNGTTDTIRVYSTSALSSVVYSFSNLTILANPTALSFRPNGNVLAVDNTLGHIVEITSAGSLLTTYVPSAVNSPTAIMVVP